MAHQLEREPVLRTQANDNDARCRDRPTGIEHGNLALLALEITIRNQLADRAAHRLINGTCRPFRLFDSFKQVDDDQIVFRGLNATYHHADIHVSFSFSVIELPGHGSATGRRRPILTAL